jgi:hypothetical protein
MARSTSAVTAAGWWLLDAVVVTASVVLPLGMAAWPEIDGLLQRAMFAIAYLRYGAEAARYPVALDLSTFGGPGARRRPAA